MFIKNKIKRLLIKNSFNGQIRICLNLFYEEDY